MFGPPEEEQRREHLSDITLLVVSYAIQIPLALFAWRCIHPSPRSHRILHVFRMQIVFFGLVPLVGISVAIQVFVLVCYAVVSGRTRIEDRGSHTPSRYEAN